VNYLQLTISLALFSASASYGQGALKPVDALIVNPPNRPVPVSIVTPAATATVACRFDTGTVSSNNSSISSTDRVTTLASLVCPEGVSRLDVNRVVFMQFPSIHPNQVHFNVSLALRSGIPASPSIDTIIATLSDGTPDLSLARSVRVDKTAGSLLVYSMNCSSGIAGYVPVCGGSVFLIGTPAN